MDEGHSDDRGAAGSADLLNERTAATRRGDDFLLLLIRKHYLFVELGAQ